MSAWPSWATACIGTFPVSPHESTAQLTSRRCRHSTGTGCPAAILSVNQFMSSSAGLAQPGGSGAALRSSQQTASSAEVCSITTCVTWELGRGWGQG